MIQHCVFCKIDAGVPASRLAAVMADLMALQDQIAGITRAQHGPNLDLELMSQGFTHGFTMDFESRAALLAYHDHPAHRAAGGQLVDICEGGVQGIMVFDLDFSA